MRILGVFRGEKKPRKRSLAVRLLLQPLEDRCVPSTFPVTNTNNGGANSLRAAIVNSNLHPGASGPNVIDFNLPSGSNGQILLGTPLLPITSPVDINGGADGTVQVLANWINNDNCLTIEAPGCTISGLDIGTWGGCGIQINSSNNVIEGNNIGAFGAAGVADGTGILIKGGANNTIGGTTAANANVIAQDVTGIIIDNGQENQIEGNFIGCLPNNTGLYNSLDGVEIEGAASQYNTIGGTAIGTANVISGNGESGVALVKDATVNTVAGNYIGTDLGGEGVGPNMGNYQNGIYIGSGANGNYIGTTFKEGEKTVALGNVISGNGQYGVDITGAGSDTNTLISNKIGVNITGTTALPNGLAGVLIHGGAANNLVGTSQGVGDNVISGNSAQGVVISGTNTTGNSVAGNYIGTNVDGTSVTNGSYGVMIEAGTPATL